MAITVKGKKIESDEVDTIGRIVFYSIGAYAGYKLLQKIGLVDDEEARKKDVVNAEIAKSIKFFDVDYYKTVPVSNIFKQSVTDDFAKQIFNAKGFFNDDEDTIFSVFRQQKYRSQISWLAYRFRIMYKTDLYAYLRGFLNNKEILNVFEIIQGLK